jgi:ferredoxin
MDRTSDGKMIIIQADLCIGCGLCVESCPCGAMSLQFGQARIDRGRCNCCGLCIGACPRGAIVETVPISDDKLEATISSLKHRANELIERIERLRRAW